MDNLQSLANGMCSNTIGGQIGYQSEREQFCPRDGIQFHPGDNYCARCGRPVGYLAQGHRPWSPWDPPYTITWGSQTTTDNNQQRLAQYSQAAAQYGQMKDCANGPNK